MQIFEAQLILCRALKEHIMGNAVWDNGTCVEETIVNKCWGLFATAYEQKRDDMQFELMLSVV